MPTLDWLNRDAAFSIADAVPTRVLRPHAAGHEFGQPGEAANLIDPPIYPVQPNKRYRGVSVAQQIDAALE